MEKEIEDLKKELLKVKILYVDTISAMVSFVSCVKFKNKINNEWVDKTFEEGISEIDIRFKQLTIGNPILEKYWNEVNTHRCTVYTEENE